MAIEFNNQTSSELFHENAYTNNTFSLRETEKSIKRTLENSFKYLKGVQKGYINISRFNLTEEDIHQTVNWEPYISVDKDFIDNSRRKQYRYSEFYNKYIDFDTMVANPDLFLLIPIIILDGRVLFKYKVKSSLDGHTDFIFNHFDSLETFLKEPHTINITFLKFTYIHRFTTNKFVVEKYAGVLPQSVTGIDKDSTYACTFFMLKGTDQRTWSNYFVGGVDDEGNFTIDVNDSATMDIFNGYPDVEVTVLSVDNLTDTGMKQIRTRHDNGEKSAILVIQEEEWKHYRMPVPTENLLIFKRHKLTGELTYENNREVVLHYPNIYEIKSEDLDPEVYEYRVFYFYWKSEEVFRYPDQLRYIYRYFARELQSDYETTVGKLLYEEIEDTEIQNFFFKIFAYDDPDYEYNHGDFFSTCKPYAFDYKTDKMREFIRKYPYALIPYARNVRMPFLSYFLDVKNVDLTKRVRNDTLGEATNPSDYYYFKEPFYVFMFRNENTANLDLRIFIDGLFCESVLQLHVSDIEYIYIPCTFVKEKSYIEIEQFDTYVSMNKVKFTDTETPITLEFKRKEFIRPTLYDLFVTNKSYHKLDRTKFRIYAMVGNSDYDVSDIINTDDAPNYGEYIESTEAKISEKIAFKDEDSGEVYMLLDNIPNVEPLTTYSPDNPDEEVVTFKLDETGRLPLKYMALSKLKIFCTEPEYLNQDLFFMANKIPFLSTKIMPKKGLPRIELFNGTIPWRECPSYIRTYINGRLQHIPYDISVYDETHTYLIPRCFLQKGDVMTIDITPFSYELEYTLKEVPEDFMVKLNGALSKPFDLAYYDIYLNGRKLNERNVLMITPDTFQLFNVYSRKNLKIYRRDRDYEYYGFTQTVKVPLDDIFDSEYIPEEKKEEVVFDIVHESPGNEDAERGEDVEWDNDNVVTIPEDDFQNYMFYLEIIIPRGILRPNDFFISDSELTVKYPITKERFGNPVTKRLVLRPNINNGKSKIVLKLGKPYLEDQITDITEKIDEFMDDVGDDRLLAHMADGTVLGAIIELLSKVPGTFRRDESGTLVMDVEIEEGSSKRTETLPVKLTVE